MTLITRFVRNLGAAAIAVLIMGYFVALMALAAMAFYAGTTGELLGYAVSIILAWVMLASFMTLTDDD